MDNEREDRVFFSLGGLDYAREIHEGYEEEVALLGSIMVLWNRQELALRQIFLGLLSARQSKYAKAVWDRQPTHKAKRDILWLALDTVRMSKRRRGILTWVLNRTKTLADRRNELIHAEYVIDLKTDVLHAKVNAPNSLKPPKYQQLRASDLAAVERDMVELLQATEAAWSEYDARLQRLSRELTELVALRSRATTDAK